MDDDTAFDHWLNKLVAKRNSDDGAATAQKKTVTKEEYFARTEGMLPNPSRKVRDE